MPCVLFKVSAKVDPATNILTEEADQVMTCTGDHGSVSTQSSEETQKIVHASQGTRNWTDGAVLRKSQQCLGEKYWVKEEVVTCVRI